jgi:transposase
VSREIRPNYDQYYLLPPSLDDWVPATHPVRFVRDLIDSIGVDELGLRKFKEGDDGRPHYAPDLLLKVWVYGFMERIRSSRALERACMRDVAFLWLTGNLHPDHNTLWRFFRDNKKALRVVFKKVVQVAVKADLVGFALHAVDGTKIAAASSMDTAHHRKALAEKLKRVEGIIEEAMARIEHEETTESPSYRMPDELGDAQARKATITAALAQLDEADTNHLHPKECEARVMKSRTSRTLSFNAQAVADRDSDLVLAIDVTGAETDHGQLVSMLDRVEENTGRVAEQTAADAGYWSGEEIAKAEKRRLPVLVSEQAPSERGAFAKENFQFDPERNGYVCPRGEFLSLESTCRPTTGKSYTVSIYRCQNMQCTDLAKCTTNKRGRSIKRSEHEDALRRQSHKQSDPTMRRLLRRRRAIIEHIFGIAKGIDGFRRFTMRGLVAASAQWALVCTAINVRKLYAFWTAGRLQLVS